MIYPPTFYSFFFKHNYASVSFHSGNCTLDVCSMNLFNFIKKSLTEIPCLTSPSSSSSLTLSEQWPDLHYGNAISLSLFLPQLQLDYMRVTYFFSRKKLINIEWCYLLWLNIEMYIYLSIQPTTVYPLIIHMLKYM